MKFKLIRDVEHWSESRVVGEVIDQVEAATGYGSDSFEEYYSLIELLRNAVESTLHFAGHDIEWCNQQSVGMGCILQGPWSSHEFKQKQQDIFDAALLLCSNAFANDCKAYCEVELEQLESDEQAWQATTASKHQTGDNQMAKEWNDNLLEEINIDTEALVEAVDSKTKHAIFEDSYGDGVALVDGVSYKTYHDLAAAFGLDAADFQV